jgi:uncharacterized membrane protein
MKNLQSKKIIAINIIVTFLEGFAAAWLALGNDLTEQALVGAVAAGISAVWNIIIKVQLKKRTELYSK